MAEFLDETLVDLIPGFFAMLFILMTIAAFLTAWSRTCYKLSMRRFSGVSVLITAQIVAAVLSLPLLFIFFPSGSDCWPLLFLEAILWAGFLYCEVRSFEFLDLGVAAVLGSAEYLLQMLIGVVAFNETLYGSKGIGFLLVSAGLIVSADWDVPRVRKGAFYQLGAAVCCIAALPVDVLLVKQISPWFVTAFAYLGPALLLLLWRKKERSEVLSVLRSGYVPYLSGVFNISGYSLLLYVLSKESFTSSLSQFQLMTCFTILLGWFVLNEKGNMGKKVLSCCLVMAGTSFFG